MRGDSMERTAAPFPCPTPRLPPGALSTLPFGPGVPAAFGAVAVEPVEPPSEVDASLDATTSGPFVPSGVPFPGSRDRDLWDRKSGLRSKILSYFTLREGPVGKDFAGNDILNPSRRTVREALRFLDLLPRWTPLPAVGRADDGEINFFWRRTGVFIDVGLYGDGNLYYLARIDSLDLDRDGMQPIGAPVLPRDLIVALGAVET